MKSQGGDHFRAGRYAEAARCYSGAIDAETDPVELAKLLGNRSASYGLLSKHKEALADATRAVELDPNYIKGYFRQTTAHMALGQFSKAEKTASTGLRRQPDNKQLQQLLEDAKAKGGADNDGSPPAPAAPPAGGNGMKLADVQKEADARVADAEARLAAAEARAEARVREVEAQADQHVAEVEKLADSRVAEAQAMAQATANRDGLESKQRTDALVAEVQARAEARIAEAVARAEAAEAALAAALARADEAEAALTRAEAGDEASTPPPPTWQVTGDAGKDQAAAAVEETPEEKARRMAEEDLKLRKKLGLTPTPTTPINGGLRRLGPFPVAL